MGDRLPREVLSRIFDFLDEPPLLAARAVSHDFHSVASPVANQRFGFASRVKGAREAYCMLQVLPAFVGALLLISHLAIILACWLALHKHHPKSCSLALGITGLNAALYIALYVGWLLRVLEVVRIRHRQLLAFSLVLCTTCVALAIIGCVHTPSRKLRVALILPGPFGFVFVSFWTAFWDTQKLRQRRRAKPARVRPAPGATPMLFFPP
eukprot:EG_transcript_29294